MQKIALQKGVYDERYRLLPSFNSLSLSVFTITHSSCINIYKFDKFYWVEPDSVGWRRLMTSQKRSPLRTGRHGRCWSRDRQPLRRSEPPETHWRLPFKLSTTAVLKLGVATLLRVAKFQIRVAKLWDREKLWFVGSIKPKIQHFTWCFYMLRVPRFLEGRKIKKKNNFLGSPLKKFENPCCTGLPRDSRGSVPKINSDPRTLNPIFRTILKFIK